MSLTTLRLRNAHLEVSVLPSIGAKIWDLIHVPTGFNVLWHNPRIPPRPFPIDANFDNYWCGGWDDGFPTCDACEYRGEQYPSLGELRSVEWTVDSYRNQGDDRHIELSAWGPINPVRARKSIRLDLRSLTYQFSVQNVGPLPCDFIWGTHPAFLVAPGSILHIPAQFGVVGQATDPSFGSPGQRYCWPHLKTPTGAVDVSRVLGPDAGIAAGHYATDLSAGWYAVENVLQGLGVLVEFPLNTCPYLWMWLTYGGWRGYYVAIIEPWTSYPVNLAAAVAKGTHRVLAPGATFLCEIRITVWAHPETLETTRARAQSG